VDFFKINDYSIQFVFFFSFINLQIVLAFLASSFFSNVKTAQGKKKLQLFSMFIYNFFSSERYVMFLLSCLPAIAYLYIFGSGLIAGNLIRNFIEGGKFPSKFSDLFTELFCYLFAIHIAV